MSFYTALTGLNAATASLSVTSNNIANVGTTGFKRSRADFGDIFATSPLQKASSVIGQGTALKQVSQEFSQGNINFQLTHLILQLLVMVFSHSSQRTDFKIFIQETEHFFLMILSLW